MPARSATIRTTPAKKVIAAWQEKCPAKTHVEDLLCTDCHGDHRLKVRTVRWDKHTRKLIADTAKIRMSIDGGSGRVPTRQERAGVSTCWAFLPDLDDLQTETEI